MLLPLLIQPFRQTQAIWQSANAGIGEGITHNLNCSMPEVKTAVVPNNFFAKMEDGDFVSYVP